MTQFDFTDTFRRVATMFTTELKRLMYQQRGVDGSAYAALAPETVKQKRAISSQTASLRMIRTKDFVNRAFGSQVSKDNVRIFVSPNLHGRDLRTARKAETKKRLAEAALPYNKIAEYQLETGNSKFFPQTDQDVESMEIFPRVKQMLLDDALRQAREKFVLQIRAELHVG